MKKFLLLVTLFVALANTNVAQDVFDPNDPATVYDPANPPVQPPAGQIGKWVRTIRPELPPFWDVARFKPYIYNGMAFRLSYPNNFNKADQTTKYPLILFLHGGGEVAPITDNEWHLLLGAKDFQRMMNQGKFNAYMLFPQQVTVGFEPYFDRINNVIDSLVKYGNVDPDRVIVMGLSIGANGSIKYASSFPTRAASVVSSSPSFIQHLIPLQDSYLHVPLWVASGGLDPNPDPSNVNLFVNNFRDTKGGKIRYDFFPGADHNSWTPQWAMEDVLAASWNAAHKANPLVFFDRRQYCPDTAVNTKIGISPGFHQYEWQKDNVTIATSTAGVHTIINPSVINSFTGNEITVNAIGTYRTRFKRTATGEWSAWSPLPAVITPRTATAIPTIVTTGMKSRVLPSVDGSTTVPLELPAGMITYEWRRVSDNVIVSTQRTFAAGPGQYRARIKASQGCISEYSAIFTVVDAAGNPKPDAAKNLTAFAVSESSVQLNWSQNGTPLSNETGFEVFRSTTPGGPYSLVAITASNAAGYLDQNISPQTTYYYKIRAFNETGASGLTSEVSAKTIADVIAPTAPSDLKTVFTFRTFVDLIWNSSKDNVGIDKYDIYVNGVKRYTTSDTSFRVNNLQPLNTFNFTVKARDRAGNVSPASNQVTASSILGGLKYRYYEGFWNQLPNFNALVPVKTGITPNIDIVTPRNRADLYGLVWEGYINFPVAGTYTFKTISDDGSKVYVKSFYDHAAPAVVVNDAIQAPTARSGTITIDTAGTYPIAITFFENSGGEAMELYWTGPAGSGIPEQRIPNSAFNDTYTVPGSVPAAPTALNATGVAYNRINLSWTDNSANETGFEVSRSTTLNGVFQSIGTVTTNSFADTGLNAATTYFYRVKAIGSSGESVALQGQGNTLAAPVAPNTPGTVAATVISRNRINLSWNDLSSGETGFEIYRSTNTADNFRLLTTVAPNTGSYADEGLFPNTNYYYKIKAIVVGNSSAFSNQAFGRTSNSKPAIEYVEDFTMKYGTTFTVPISVNDADNDDLVITTSALPRFATLVNTGNGTRNLVLAPRDVHRGNYPIKIYVDDLNGGRDTMSFNMIVNNNSVPTLENIANFSVNEGESGTVFMTANDAETVSAINWTFEGLPNFASFSKDNAGHGNIVFSPGFATSGTYNIRVKADDGYGAWTSKSFMLTVVEKPAGTLWLINIKESNVSPKTPFYWNDIEKISNFITLSNAKTSAGINTPVGVNIPEGWNIYPGAMGVNTDTGVYPRPVIRDGFYAPIDTMFLNITNLNPARLYNFRFLSSSEINYQGFTGFRFGAKRDSIAMRSNTKNRAKLNSLAPDASGNITIKLYRIGGAPAIILNAFEFQEVFNDGSLPATPTGISAVAMPGAGNRIGWRDIAYNETSYRVFRSESRTGPYTALNPTADNADDSSYTDRSAARAVTYFYFVRAVNTIGNSAASDTVSVITGNNPPVVSPIQDVYLKTGNSLNVDFTASDDPGETLTVTTENLPPFATLQSLGGSNYRISFNPTVDHTGFYYVTVTATDIAGGTTSRQFKITVSDNAVTRTVLLNFTGNNAPVSPPWNNLETDGFLNSTGNTRFGSIVSTNMKADDGANTSFTFTSIDYITRSNEGFITGNNSGIVPDSVLAGGIGVGGVFNARFKLGGLDPTKTYSIGIISSVNSGDKNISTFTATGNGATQTINFNGRYNNAADLRFNGLIPTAGGEINFTMTSETAIPGAIASILLNAMIIQEYTGLLRPINLKAEPVNTVTKRKIRVTWSDRTSTETTFEVQRSLTPDFAAFTTTSLPANTTVHVDSSLGVNTKYFYRVRALTGGGNTVFSNASSAISAASIVYVNMTNGTLASAPWNNTAKLPVAGEAFPNLKNENNQNSGITLTLDSSFKGSENFGYYAPANAGILPSAVVTSNYTIDPGKTVRLRLSGLDLSKSYRLGFSGSLGGNGLFNTSYAVGSRKVYLNASFNTNKLVYIDDIIPNSNGEIIIYINAVSGTGFLNALTIESYTGTNGPVLQSPLNSIQSGRPLEVTTLPEAAEAADVPNIYPNPFNDNLNIDFLNLSDNSKIKVEIYDLMGRIVYSRDFNNFAAGRNTLRLSSISRNMAPGVYMLKLNIEGKAPRLIKLVKTSK